MKIPLLAFLLLLQNPNIRHSRLFPPIQMLLIGFVKGDFNEHGTFSLSELESVKGPMGLGIERDIYFVAKAVSKCK